MYRKFLLIAVAAVLLLPTLASGAYVSDIMRISGTQYQTAFSGLDGEKHSVKFTYNDAFFYDAATQRDNELAKASAVLSALAYDEYSLSETLTKMEFENIYSMDYQDTPVLDTSTAPVTFATKKIMNGLYDLIVIVIRGTGNKGEMLSNLDLGLGEKHAGFSKAAHSVMTHFRMYYEAMRQAGVIDDNAENNRIWITGHSRGAAVANMLAAYLNDDTSGNFSTSENHLFAYTFAAPNVTREDDITADCRNIFNFVNPGDLVCSVPMEEWGYSRYGMTISWDQDETTGRQTESLFMDMMGYRYRGTTVKANRRLLESIDALYTENRLDLEDMDVSTTAIRHAHSMELYICWMDVVIAEEPAAAETETVSLSLAEVKNYFGKTRAQIAALTSSEFVRSAEYDPYHSQSVTMTFDDWNDGQLECVMIGGTGTVFDTIRIGMTTEQIKSAWNIRFFDDGGIEMAIWRGEKNGLEIFLYSNGWNKTDPVSGIRIFWDEDANAVPASTPQAATDTPATQPPTAAPVGSTLSGDARKLIGIWTAELLGISTSMEFKTDGTMIITSLGIAMQYNYSVSGNQIYMSMGNPYVQGGVQQLGTSTFTISSDQLLIDGIVYTRFK